MIRGIRSTQSLYNPKELQHMNTYTRSCSYTNCLKTFSYVPHRPKKYCSILCAKLSRKPAIKFCKKCSIQLAGYQKKFCSSSCAGSYNNIGIRRHGQGPLSCEICSNTTSSCRQRFCSNKCQGISKKKYKTIIERRKNNAAGQSRYRAKKYRVLDPTANNNRIKEIYQNCPIGFEVDHIIPLSKGGKHHENNLQYLTILDNRRKGNRI